MTNTAKFTFFAFALTVLFFSLTNCDVEPVIEGEVPYLSNTLFIDNQQVWTRNRQARKISQAYIKYGENRDLYALVLAPYVDLTGTENIVSKPVGSGKITNGILNLDYFNLDEQNDLYDWNYPNINNFKLLFSSYWKDVNISDSSVKGNLILLEALSGGDPAGLLDRQRIYGTDTLITCEIILYIYVNKDCTITGKAGHGYISGQYYYYTGGDLNLNLKKGINMICRTETYATDFNGSAVISMEIRNPIQNPEKFKWVIEPDFNLNSGETHEKIY